MENPASRSLRTATLVHGTATRVVFLLCFVERLDFLCQFPKPGLNCEIDRILGVLTFCIAFTGFDLCQQLNSFVNGGNRINVEFPFPDSFNDLFAQHQMLNVAIRDNDSLFPGETF